MSRKKPRVLVVLGGNSGERAGVLKVETRVKALRKKKYYVRIFDPKLKTLI